MNDNLKTVARFEGRCAHCDGLIKPGMRIEKTLLGWEHEDCPADPPDPDPYDDEDNYSIDWDLPWDLGGPP